MKGVQKINLTAVTVSGGIIQVIGESGNIEYYAQRGIHKLPLHEQTYAIEIGMIDCRAFSLEELPEKYTISFENRGMGRAVANFNRKWLYK